MVNSSEYSSARWLVSSQALLENEDVSPTSLGLINNPQQLHQTTFDDVFGAVPDYTAMEGGLGGGKAGGDEMVAGQVDAYDYEYDVNGGGHWSSLNPESSDAALFPSYLLASSQRSPGPADYTHTPILPAKEMLIKQEPYSPAVLNVEEKELRGGFTTASAAPPQVRASQRRPIPSRKLRHRNDLLPASRPLVERQKRPSDDDEEEEKDDETESMSSFISDTPTDGSSSVHSIPGVGGLPVLPRIATVTFASAGEPAKRQRRDVSMSAPAVAARELRQKKKVREEQLIQECEMLKAEAENLERATAASQSQVEKLREDALYLRSLVRSQQTTVQLLEYLKKAPFFADAGQKLQLDSRSMLRHISGSGATTTDAHVSADESKADIGGVCFHINGSKMTLHLCSHCSSEATNTN
ncbi:hypothetical protein BV898_02067 [Hypsibius exemplaris]|uniref:BZIP domain-containing protein n=1 Tax=Hypsibius exemplaris TaxID=2072580 RepID=A0A1W0X9A1_HYPEX|nr:hypothetical protein BV898_02067 [Hypsibius exemplaris]